MVTLALLSDYQAALMNLNDNLIKNADSFKQLAEELNKEISKTYNANAKLLQADAELVNATGVTINDTLINRSDNVTHALNSIATGLQNINTEAPKLLQKVGMFSGTPAPKAGAPALNAALSESIQQFDEKNARALQQQFIDLNRLMKTEKILNRDDAVVKQILTLINEMGRDLQAYLNKGHELKQQLNPNLKLDKPIGLEQDEQAQNRKGLKS